MFAAPMKIPLNGTTRLSKETWINAEILKRYRGAKSIRRIIEAVIDETVTSQLSDPKFIKVFQEFKTEGIDDDAT